MPKSRRKFAQWTYKDEATNRDHSIQVYITVDDAEKVEFEAEVKTPVKFNDADENANTLRLRVLERCAKERQLVWVYHLLITSYTEGFQAGLFVSREGRRYCSVGFLIEEVEIAVLDGGKTIWRGLPGGSHRFGPNAKPGLPATGTTNRGECCLIEVTSEVLVAVQNLFEKFTKVAKGMTAATRQKGVKRMVKLMASGADGAHWSDFFRKSTAATVNGPVSNDKEDPCQPTNELSSESPEPNAAATAALPTAGLSLAT